MNSALISIIIPVKNSAKYLNDCLDSIDAQTYKNIEVLLVDNNSQDDTLKIAKAHSCRVLQYDPGIKITKFDAPYKRNYGVKEAAGKYIYYLDADMELPNTLIEEIMTLFSTATFSALIVPEDSIGVGIWAEAKQLERRCYWGDTTIEAARVFKKDVWDTLGGLDTSLGGGGDDWDLHHRLLAAGYSVGRTKAIVLHNEGHLNLFVLMKKRFMYGRDSVKYLVKRPKASFTSYFPIRAAYINNWRLFLKSPSITLAFVIMRTSEYLAGFLGIIYSFTEHEK